MELLSRLYSGEGSSKFKRGLSVNFESYLIELSKSYTPNTLLDIGAQYHGNFSMFCKKVGENIDSLMLEGNENSKRSSKKVTIFSLYCSTE